MSLAMFHCVLCCSLSSSLIVCVLRVALIALNHRRPVDHKPVLFSHGFYLVRHLYTTLENPKPTRINPNYHQLINACNAA